MPSLLPHVSFEPVQDQRDHAHRLNSFGNKKNEILSQMHMINRIRILKAKNCSAEPAESALAAITGQTGVNC